jgi:hypothetical protein
MGRRGTGIGGWACRADRIDSLLFLDAHEPPPKPARPYAARCPLAAQIQLQASLRDADHIYGQPGDKSPGYDRASLRDEVKTGFPNVPGARYRPKANLT